MSRTLLCLLASALLTAACASDEERVAQHIERAEAYLAKGENQAGLLELRSALQLAPQDAELNFRIAEILREAGRLEDALFHFAEATRLAPNHEGGALGQAELLMFQDTDAARALVEGVLERNPRSALGHVRRSELALVDSDTALALQAAERAVELDPDGAAPRFQLGMVRRAQIRERELRREPADERLYRAAIEAFERAAERIEDPRSANLDRAWLERAVVLVSWPGHETEAAAAFREAAEAIEALPVSADRKVAALEQAVRYGAQRGDTELQRWALERIVALSPDQLNAWSRLATLAGAGQGAAALEALLAARPDDPQAHVVYARRLAWEGRSADALAHLEKAAAELAEPWPAVEATVELYLEAGDLAKARTAVERLSKERPNEPGTRIASARLAGAENRVEEAVATLRQLVGEDADNAIAHQVLADLEGRLGRADAAVASMRRAVELTAPASPWTWLRTLGRLEIQARDWRGAVGTYRELYRRRQALEVDDVVRLARALYELGKVKAARKQLEHALAFEPTPLAAVMMFARRESRNDPERAQALLEQAAARHPEDEAVVRQLVLLELQRKGPEAALARVDAVLVDHAGAARLHLLRARVLLALGRLDPAHDAARQAIALDAGLPGSLRTLTSILVRQGRADEAVALLEAATRGGTASLRDRLSLAGLHIERGERARAIELLEGILAERSDLPGVKNDLAFLIAQEGGDRRRALELAREARAARPELSPFADTLGYVYLQLGMHEPAIIQLQEAVQLAAEGSPARATAHHHLGLALKAAGRDSEASAAFTKALAGPAYPEVEETRRELRALSRGAEDAAGSS